jgi:hypothetical protein
MENCDYIEGKKYYFAKIYITFTTKLIFLITLRLKGLNQYKKLFIKGKIFSIVTGFTIKPLAPFF